MMSVKINSEKPQYASLETIFKEEGFTDYKWIDSGEIVVAQWVRMKCMFGCDQYGRKAACPPQTLSVSDCERFFNEYNDAVVFHLKYQIDSLEERNKWNRKTVVKLAGIERKVFLAGFEKAYMLLSGGCVICEECSGIRTLCKHPELARPAPEGLSVDVFSTVRKIGYPISVRTDTSQAVDRYYFLMVE